MLHTLTVASRKRWQQNPNHQSWDPGYHRLDSWPLEGTVHKILTVRTWKWTIPKGKGSSSNHHFSCDMLNFRKGIIFFLASSTQRPHFFWLGKAAPRFGNLIETMISLWSAVSGGNDWMNYGELLRCGKFKWWGFDWNLGNMFGIEMEILPYPSYTPGSKKRSSSPKAPLKHDARSHFLGSSCQTSTNVQHTWQWCRIKLFSNHRMCREWMWAEQIGEVDGEPWWFWKKMRLHVDWSQPLNSLP